MSATITADQLREVHACRPQLQLFVKTFGESTTVTAVKCRKFAELFDWDWAYRLLDDKGWTEYDRARSTALAKHNLDRAPARAEYKRATATARVEYERSIEASRAEFDRAKATAWSSAYIATCKRKEA